MASKSGDVTDEDDLDVDVDAQARLQAVTLGMKRQADELLLANQLDKALTLYRELLMHLTRSQVALQQQKELVISCHMNALAALSKAKRWSSVVSEAAETFAVLGELKEARGAADLPHDNQQRENQVLARAFYFRGFAYMKLGSFQPAQQDFRRAMELNPEDETIQSDYKELQTALLAEQKVKQFLATSMKFFQAGNYKAAVEACVSALRESQLLQKTELTGLIHGNLAAIYVKMKDDAKAIEHYKRTMLLTRCGGNPTAAQNERMFDILDSLAGCYSRKRDYSSALSVIEDQTKLFPLCPDRKDREAMMFLNAGRICYTMGRCPQAEERLEKGYNAARKVSNQLDVALNCAYWLSKAYLKNNKADKARETLDVTIPLAEEDAAVASTGELLEKLMLARLDLLDPDFNSSATEGSTFKGSLRETQLWQTLEYFEGKRQICGHVRAAEVLVSFLQAKGDLESDEGHSELMRALTLVHCVNIGKLSTSEATTFTKLALFKVDLLASSNFTGQQEARALLVKLLRDLELPGGADPCCRQQLRAKVLCRLVDLFESRSEGELDDDDRKILENAVDVLREDKIANKPIPKTKLSVLLPMVGRWRAGRGDIVGAEEVLAESVELLRGTEDSNNDRLCEALIGLCVVQIRLGMVEEAAKVVAEIESFSMAQNSNELKVIKDRLNAAAAEALKKKQKELDRAEKSPLFEKQQYTDGEGSFLCGIGRVWWGRWCGPLIACVAAVAMALMFA
ncbi:hypothetical protein PHYSODRAFT_533302 [Phytophthora sojae]|uniref:Uncharacterized protein n=1 Tax=Phytophthora sojae (strain P6497) TaxID=1094619 RepID=G5AEV6_PHYSP|nr:hypothetical protein PHYSODRAFT_533302 [Phytophthora sojae]EGZ05746.1 hypothetical protein PHYSODRAFT_533302 [Phytophthora sojae]|eukprot:XP_009538607.1 hypothetical protein PHYSODRAFT_533302 [Phytophthora sojae]